MSKNNLKSWDEYPVKADKRQSIHRKNAEAEKAALQCLDAFMSAFNARNGNMSRDQFNFPTYRLVGNPPRMLVIDEEQFNLYFIEGKAWQYLVNIEKWHHSSWDRRTVIWSQHDKVHLDACFSRYREDGSLIGVYESLYIVTKDKDGHWGIKLRSTSADSKVFKSKL